MEKVPGAAYIRVSTDDQLEYSPESQLKEIQRYAKTNGILLSPESIFREQEGRSGRNAKKRPEFQRMIGLAKRKPPPFRVILVWKFSRFARSREDSILYKSMLRRECGIDVISVSEPTGTDGLSVLMEAMIEAMDEYYSINLAQEVRRGMTQKAQTGGVVSAPPLGYLVRDGNFAPDPAGAQIVKDIFHQYAREGVKTLAIAKQLNDAGYRTKRGNLFDNRAVKRILANDCYIGVRRWCTHGRAEADLHGDNSIVTEHAHEPIIDRDTWNLAQQRRHCARATWGKYSHPTGSAHEFFLRGLLRCSNCGATLVYAAGHRVQCHQYSKGLCQISHSAAQKDLQARVLAIFRRDMEKYDALTLIFPSSKSTQPLHVEGYAQRLSALHRKLERIKAAYADGIDTLEEYKANKQAVNGEIARLVETQQTQPAPPAKQDFLSGKIYCAEVLMNPQVSVTAKNDMIHAVIERIVYNRRENRLLIFYRP